jgi:signal transduction histidine kinase
VSWRRLLAGGLLAAALAGLAGGALEYWRFGPTDATAAARVEAMVREEFDAMTGALAQVASGIASNRSASDALVAGPEGARAIFDLLASVRGGSPHPDDIAATVYAADGVALAWTGRPSNIPAERIVGHRALFVTPSALGLRLVYLEPITGNDARRLGSVAAEHVLSRAAADVAIAPATYALHTSIAPVSLRLGYEGAGEDPRDGAFLLRTPAGDPLVEASIAPADLQKARTVWRSTVVACVIVLVGITLLLLIGPLLDRRARAGDQSTLIPSTVAASLLLIAGAGAIWLARAWADAGWPGVPVNLTFCGATLAALAALWAGPVARLRPACRRNRRFPRDAFPQFVVVQLLAGIALALFILLFARVLAVAVNPPTVDLRHFSLFPWNALRILRLVGIFALHVTVMWTAVLTLIVARAGWRLPRKATGVRLALLALWLLPTALVAIVTITGRWPGPPVPISGLIMTATTCGVAALFARRVVARYRHATVAARIFVLFVAFLVPAVLLSPSLDFFADRAIQRLIRDQYAVQAQKHSEELLKRLNEARSEIDALPSLPDLVSNSTAPPLTPPGTNSAFYVWSQTVLARARLTSAVELYNQKSDQVSRFALNLPEYTGSGQRPHALSACEWDVYAEPLPIGSDERLVLHAERGICNGSGGDGPPPPVGTIVLHVAFDYRTLPFITSQSPYFELFRPNQGGAPSEAARGNDVEVAIYGWGLRPVYTSGRAAWPITDALFGRLYDPERKPFWETIRRGDVTYRVYFTNDRARIYAIGYPIPTLFDHLVHLAELTTLAGATFVLVLLGTGVFTRVSRERPRVGRALLREIRASFYRKLFLAFVLASIIPVLTLALVIRAYFADLLRNDIQAEAARTAAVAERVIEESDALLRRGAEGVGPITDDVMVFISQVIDQDVNIFEGPELVATSERDLFSSGLLPTRTPDGVYRAIALERLPSFVDEDELGSFPFMIAATPVRANNRDAILTVPLALRQRETRRQIEDLDRGVHLAVLFFILLGAAIGLSLAERIADPVRRLTRATQRIGRGDFDARIVVKSVDELRRLVDAFNSMAEELKAQRVQLERTHRLEAWAEMARQVAHEIKNPLTPIQLSAEHLRRVHADQGKPIGPVLDGCVDAILGQVRLLRQIAAEFSSFASSPSAKVAPVDVSALVEEILEPYRAGLAGRIEIQNGVNGPLPRVLVDRTLVLRSLVNIVENALHAMPGLGQLVVTASSDDRFVTITVRDTGVGMDEEALARVFEPYFSTKTSGTGLGLPIAQRNIEANGGMIEVDSQKGVGTTVRVRLPVSEGAEGAEGITPGGAEERRS